MPFSAVVFEGFFFLKKLSALSLNKQNRSSSVRSYSLLFTVLTNYTHIYIVIASNFLFLEYTINNLEI